MIAIFTAILVAIPATILALAAWREARTGTKQTAAPNGMNLGKMVEETRADVRQLKNDLAYHVTVQHGRGPLPR